MASHQPPRSSLWSKPFLVLKLGCARLRAAGSFAFNLLPNTLAHGWPVLRTLVRSVAYSEGQYLTFHENRYLSDTTGKVVAADCKSAGVSHDVHLLQSEGGAPAANLHYLNCKVEDKGNVLLYFHGGGFGSPMVQGGHVPYLLEVGRAASINNIVLLEYGLAPELQYPGQLVQAISALRHLLKTHPPSEIAIGGDSAGGNLSLALLAHIIEPSPYVEPLTMGGGKLRGALLVSPWVTFETTGATFKSNAGKDILTTANIPQFVDAYAARREVYAQPLLAPAEFWKDLPVQKTLLTAGTWEVFDSDIREQAQKLSAEPLGANTAVELALAEKEIHIQSVLDYLIGIKPPAAKMSAQILDWCKRLD